MLSVICFSKDRPLQLEGYIQSMLFYSGLGPESLSILYVDSPSTSYKSLVERYPLVNWVRETHFYSDLTKMVESAREHILLGCDDVFFIDYFDPAIAIDRLANDSDLFGFSLRLGLNLMLNPMPDIRVSGDTLEWEWRSAPSGNWNYPWEVSGSIYRKSFVQAYLESNSSSSNPNRFEFLFYNHSRKISRDAEPKLGCFRRSKCLTLTVNRVQDDFENVFDGSAETEITALHKAYSAGQRLDWPSFYQVKNREIHVGARYFRLTSNVVTPATKTFASKASQYANLSNRQVQMYLLMWRNLIKFKEYLRRWTPRWFWVMLRKYAGFG